MHTLSLFPRLLDYGQVAPFIIRITLAAVLLHWSYRALKNAPASAGSKSAGLLEAAVGILLLIGLWTQAAALIAGVDLVIRLIGRVSNRAFLTDGVNYYLILLVLALSLIVTGAGWLAFDLHL